MSTTKTYGRRRDASNGNRLWIPVLLLIPAVEFWAVEWFTHNPWTTMFFKVQVWGILFYELIFWGLYLLTGSLRMSLIPGTIFFAAAGTLNYYVMHFRSAPIVPWDIYSLKTAAAVADNYDYTPELKVILLWGIFLLLLLIGILLKHKNRWKLPVRLGSALLVFLLLGGYLGLLSQDTFIRKMKLDNTLFTPHVMARKNGFVTSFLMDLRYLKIKAPEGYSREDTKSQLSSYPVQDHAEDLPDIIVIMDEAFSDPAVLAPFETNEDYMPFLHSLQAASDPTIATGWLNVSVKGGNTANTEYEYLTGNSMRFLPGGSVPYQQYIFGPKASMVSGLNALGYETSAIHPFNSTGWNRDKVYANFGFHNIYFNSAFSHPERVRKYISDRACFDKIRELLPQDTESAPRFIFAVTMQNHSSYTERFENFIPDITVPDAPAGTSKNLLEHYLSLMKLTDLRIRELLEDLSSSPRRTMVVFFGDHQPNDIVIESIWRMNQTSSSALTEEQQQARYKVPFLVWSNYGADLSGIPAEESVNYLGSRVLQSAGIPLTDWQQAELELAEQIPLITTQVFDSEGTEDDEEAESRYRRLQYYQMFDRT